MDKFIKFRDSVNLDELSRTVRDDRVFVLRESKLTGTIKVRVVEHVTNRQLKKALEPFEVEKVYDELPVETLPDRSDAKTRIGQIIERLFGGDPH